MFERLISFLNDIPGGGSGGERRDDSDDPRLAAAALMVHVMDADGVRLDEERAKLREALTRAYGLSGAELDRYILRAEEEAHEAVDLYAFTSILKRHLDERARIEFIGIMWEIVFADGEMNELEDNIVWRVAELIGVDRRDRVLMRQKADPSRNNSEPGL